MTQPDDDVYSEPIVAIVPVGNTEEAAAILGTAWPLDDALLVWLEWESFTRHAASKALELVTFEDKGEVPRAQIPPAAEQVLISLGVKGDEITWRRFEGIAQRPPLSYWLEAESIHETGQAAIEQGQLPYA